MLACRSPFRPRTARLVSFVLALILPAAAAAQPSEAGVGVGVTLSHFQWLDVPSLCCPPQVWLTFGEGRWGLQLDYLRSYRQVEVHAGYPIDDVDGRRASLQRAFLRVDLQHHASVLASWRALESPRYRLSLLFGGLYRHARQADRRATAGPVASHVRSSLNGASHHRD